MRRTTLPRTIPTIAPMGRELELEVEELSVDEEVLEGNVEVEAEEVERTLEGRAVLEMLGALEGELWET